MKSNHHPSHPLSSIVARQDYFDKRHLWQSLIEVFNLVLNGCLQGIPSLWHYLFLRLSSLSQWLLRATPPPPCWCSRVVPYWTLRWCCANPKQWLSYTSKRRRSDSHFLWLSLHSYTLQSRPFFQPWYTFLRLNLDQAPNYSQYDYQGYFRTWYWEYQSSIGGQVWSLLLLILMMKLFRSEWKLASSFNRPLCLSRKSSPSKSEHQPTHHHGQDTTSANAKIQIEILLAQAWRLYPSTSWTTGSSCCTWLAHSPF